MASAALPLVISCQGGTPAARRAARVAAELERLGVAEALQDVDLAASAARDGRTLVVLDGCSSACCTHLLQAKGIRPLAAFDVAELRGSVPAPRGEDPNRLAEEVAFRLRSRRLVRGQPRPARPARPAPAPRTKRAHTDEDYLLAIDALASTTVECGALAAEAPTLAAHVSRVLGVSRAAAGEMLARLEQRGLVERSARRELLLTDRGRAAADRAVRRHRLLECFVKDVLGYPLGACYEQARMLGGAFDDGAIERLGRALRHPARCPHGWPVDAALAREESRELTSVRALGEGDRATVVRVAEQDGYLVDRLVAVRLTPRARLTAKGRQPSGAVSVQVEGRVQALDAEAAGALFVLLRS